MLSAVKLLLQGNLTNSRWSRQTKQSGALVSYASIKQSLKAQFTLQRSGIEANFCNEIVHSNELYVNCVTYKIDTSNKTAHASSREFSHVLGNYRGYRQRHLAIELREDSRIADSRALLRKETKLTLPFRGNVSLRQPDDSGVWLRGHCWYTVFGSISSKQMTCRRY